MWGSIKKIIINKARGFVSGMGAVPSIKDCAITESLGNREDSFAVFLPSPYIRNLNPIAFISPWSASPFIHPIFFSSKSLYVYYAICFFNFWSRVKLFTRLGNIHNVNFFDGFPHCLQAHIFYHVRSQQIVIHVLYNIFF